ncbi:MAG: hypothetical protein ACKOTF_11745, partial [Opitutaceae bacterium]
MSLLDRLERALGHQRRREVEPLRVEQAEHHRQQDERLPGDEVKARVGKRETPEGAFESVKKGHETSSGCAGPRDLGKTGRGP